MKNEELTVKSADHLDNSPIEWLIQDWIPRRGITLLCSDGGIGKSFLWISVAAALSNGNRTILDSLEINREENSIAADKEAANIELQGLTDSDKQLVEEA